MGFHPKNTVHKMGRPKNIGVHSTGYSLEICSKKGLNYSLLLKCDFDSIDSKNQISITRDSIAQWAEANNIYVDTRSLLTHLLSVVSMKRSHSGQLSKNDIETIISQYRSPLNLY